MAGIGATVFGLSLPTFASESKHCKIIGVGGAGRNFIRACEDDDTLPATSRWSTEWLGINNDHPETAREFISTFAGWLFDSDVVVLVSGLSGTTASELPTMAKLARETGAYVMAVVILPFDWEGVARTKRAVNALCQIEQEADIVLRFSNQALMDSLGEQITLAELFDVQNQRIGHGIRAVLENISS
jgi:cell division GTPase FtsZ